MRSFGDKLSFLPQPSFEWKSPTPFHRNVGRGRLKVLTLWTTDIYLLIAFIVSSTTLQQLLPPLLSCLYGWGYMQTRRLWKWHMLSSKAVVLRLAASSLKWQIPVFLHANSMKLNDNASLKRTFRGPTVFLLVKSILQACAYSAVWWTWFQLITFLN